MLSPFILVSKTNTPAHRGQGNIQLSLVSFVYSMPNDESGPPSPKSPSLGPFTSPEQETSPQTDLSDFDDTSSEESESQPALPYSAVPRVQGTETHQRFIYRANPSWVSLRISEAKRLYNKGYTASEWVPDGTQVMTTSTDHDDELKNISLSSEKQLVEHFRPDAHVPADISIYNDNPLDTRVEYVSEVAKSALYLDRELNVDVTCIPLIKGATRMERAISYEVTDFFDHDRVAAYVAQMNPGGQDSRVLNYLWDIYNESDGDLDIHVIGRLTDSICNMPPSVKSASGMNSWRKHALDANYRVKDEEVVFQTWLEIESNVTDWLRTQEVPAFIEQDTASGTPESKHTEESTDGQDSTTDKTRLQTK